MGAVISTGSWTFMDGGRIRLPTEGVFTAAGENLEGHGRQPDVLVPYDPEAIRAGRDPQIEAAVKTLLEKLPAAK
jgi:C-terminal processing protease CtpA/Prc